MHKTAGMLTRHDLEAKIVKRCWEDESFRREFTADPKATFIKHLQISAADLPAITVHQEQPGTWHIVVPPKPSGANELSDADLEQVAGGTSPVISIVATISASIAVAGGGISASVVITPDKGW